MSGELLSRSWPHAPAGAADWLRELCGDGLTGFMPPPMPDAVWVPNAMYEHDVEAVGVTTGGGLGRAGHPGPGWRRLRWLTDVLAEFSPANLWAEDRSWCLCTDYDLWGTKVAGPPSLIEALLSDAEIEAVRLPWSS